MPERRRFALVDRDGTINVEVEHLGDPSQLVLIPGSAAAIRRLRELGLGIVVVTNQAQVGRGLLDPDRLASIHERLRSMLAEQDATVEAILYCPHLPEDDCDCRKPQPGMALDAVERFGFDPAKAFVVGDHAGDMGMGRAIGATTILVLTGHGEQERERAKGMANHVAQDLAVAVGIIAGIVVPGSGAARTEEARP
jgi:D-glycero-D-manno-heptose 1,7-bisphosphate phosphatase